MDLIEFLKARIAEDEQVAFDAIDGGTGSEWRANGARVEVAGGLPPDPSVFEETVVFDEGSPSEEQATHIARHDPARVLREVGAKRMIVKEHAPVTLRGGGGARYFETTTVCRSCEPPRQFPEHAYPCMTLRLLAMSYSDHADYDPAWAPTVTA